MLFRENCQVGQSKSWISHKFLQVLFTINVGTFKQKLWNNPRRNTVTFNHTPTSQGSGIISLEWVEGLSAPEVLDEYRKMVFSGHGKSVANMNSEQLWLNAKDQARQNPRMDGRDSLRSPPTSVDPGSWWLLSKSEFSLGGGGLRDYPSSNRWPSNLQ